LITLGTQTLKIPSTFVTQRYGRRIGRPIIPKGIIYSLNNALGVSGASCIILNRNMPLNSEHPPHSNSDSLVVEEMTTKSCWGKKKERGKNKKQKKP
jgi:hypothetical protein